VPHTTRRSRLARPALAVLALGLLVWLGARGARAFDRPRHVALAREVTGAPDVVTRDLPATAGGAHAHVSGRLQYRPGVWLSVVTLEGLPPVRGRERYLVFLRNWAGWSLAAAAAPDARGQAQVRFAAEPRPPTIFEAIVTRAPDDASSVPHGTPVLHWFDASLAPRHVNPFNFALGR